MRGVEYAELEAFLAVAREGSFRHAAEALAVSASAISHTIRALEERLALRLFHRTTRSLRLTDEGSALRERIAPAFDTIAASVALARQSAQRPSGTVKLTVPRAAARMILEPRLPAFLLDYPDIRVEVDVNDRVVDSVAEGFDAGIRLGEMVSGEMQSLAVSQPLRGIFVAAPVYLGKHGVPRTPEQVRDHTWLNIQAPSSGRAWPWEFKRGAEHLALSQPGPLASNDLGLLIAAAVAGCGIACVTEGMVDEEVRSGRLVTVLEEWCESYPGWYLYYPKGRIVAPALRLLCEHLVKGSGAGLARRDVNRIRSGKRSSS